MKTLALFVLLGMFLCPTLRSQTDTAKVNGWWTTDTNTYSRIVKDTASEGNYSQAFGVFISPGGSTSWWTKKFGKSYPKPSFVGFDYLMNPAPREILNSAVIVRVVFLSKDSAFEVRGCGIPMFTTFQWQRGLRLTNFNSSENLPDSIDGIEIGFYSIDPTISGSFEILLDNFNFVYWKYDTSGLQTTYVLVDRFGDPDDVVMEPKLSYSPKSANFGILKINEVPHKDTLVTFRNTGNDTLKGVVSVVGRGFSMTDTNNLLIAPMDSTTKIVRFAPSESGEMNGLLVITSNAPSSPDTIFLTGIGDTTITGIVDNPKLPKSFSLNQNYPNPFNPTTTITYDIPAGTHGHTSLKVYDIMGREVATLVNEMKAAGTYHVTFNASKLASGIYFYRLQSGSFNQTKKLVLLK